MIFLWVVVLLFGLKMRCCGFCFCSVSTLALTDRRTETEAANNKRHASMICAASTDTKTKKFKWLEIKHVRGKGFVCLLNSNIFPYPWFQCVPFPPVCRFSIAHPLPLSPAVKAFLSGPFLYVFYYTIYIHLYINIVDNDEQWLVIRVKWVFLSYNLSLSTIYTPHYCGRVLMA